MKEDKEGIDYKEYIQSPEWAERRTRFFRSGMPSDHCTACGLPRESGFHLHHRTYKRLGAEHLGDLILLCPRCHSELHRGFKESGANNLWAYTKRWTKSKRKRAWCAPEPPPMLHWNRR